MKQHSTNSFRSNPTNNSDNFNEEIDLKELIVEVWKRKWTIIGATTVFAILSVLFALKLPDEYKSTVILAPASQSGSSSLASLAGQFGGLASLAGINLGAGGADNKAIIAMKVIPTWGFLEKFIEDNQIQAEVLAARGWDKVNDKLIYDNEIYDEKNKTWLDEDGNRVADLKPSSWLTYKTLKNRIFIQQDKVSGLVTITVEYYSPVIAKIWVEKLVAQVNQHFKVRDELAAKNSIKYLNEKIRETQIAEMKSVFYRLIEEQTKTLMLANSTPEYVFKTISEPKVAEEKSKPKRALICIAGTFLGGFISVVFVLISFLLRSSKSN